MASLASNLASLITAIGTAYKGLKFATISTKTASYTLVIGDSANVQVQMNVGTANTLTVPTNATVAFPIGTVVLVRQIGAGKTTVAGASGVTVNSRGGVLGSAGQYAEFALTKIATDTWNLTGDLV